MGWVKVDGWDCFFRDGEYWVDCHFTGKKGHQWWWIWRIEFVWTQFEDRGENVWTFMYSAQLPMHQDPPQLPDVVALHDDGFEV
jgi:hypothetical protein